MTEAGAINDFWLDEVGEAGWYNPPEGLDERIRDSYAQLWETARTGGLDHWARKREGALALLILTDQFPRNMFRGSAEAFATDARALALAAVSIAQGYDIATEGPARQFFYLPFMHSEVLGDQERAVRLFLLRMPGGNVVHARAHREVIRRFGRFPYRNEALGRRTTAREAAFLEAGGYAEAVRVVSS